MSHNSRLATTASPHSEMSDSPRPRYFLVRYDGALTPLVAVDELPPSLRIRGVPAVLSYANTQGMVSLGVVARSERRYILESSAYSSPNRVGTPSSGQPAMISRPSSTEEHVMASNGGLTKNEPSHIQHGYGTQTSPPHAAVLVPGQGGQHVEAWRQGVSGDVDEIQVRPRFSYPSPCHLMPPQATVDAIVNAATANATTATTATTPRTSPNGASSYSLRQVTPPSHTANTNPAILPPASSPPATTTTLTPTALPPTASNSASPTPSPKKKEKIYCSFWIRRGECDYTQQGCLYKHEMPTDRETLKDLGINMIPRWWREANAVKAGASGWSERAGLGAGKEKEKGMWRVGAGAVQNGETGQGFQGLGAQRPVVQTPTTLPPPQMKATEGMKMMLAAQLGGEQFTAPPMAATPASSPVRFSFPRQMMGSRYSPPVVTTAPILAATSSPTFSLPPAPAAAYRQQYTPATPNGHGLQMPAPHPVSSIPAGSRLSPPSVATRIPEPSPAAGTAATPTSASGNGITTHSIPVPTTTTFLQHPSAVPGNSPPGPMMLPAYQPLTPSSPRRQSSASSPVPQPKPVTSFDIYNSVPTPPQVHRRLFVTPGQSQFVTVAPPESGSKKATSQDEAVKQRTPKPKGLKAGQKDGVLVEFGES